MKSIRDVHEWLNRCAQMYNTLDHNERVIVDLNKLQWVSPVGSAALVATLHKLVTRYDVKIKIPDNENADSIIGYLERMDFFKVCPSVVRHAFENEIDMEVYYSRHRNDQSKALFELREANDYDEVGSLQATIRAIMTGYLEPNKISNVTRIVGELVGNSIEHGGSACYPCVQFYKSNKQVEIAICDYGKGIVRSLKKYVKHSTSHEVVEKAITTRATSIEEEDRGRGLMDVKQRTFSSSRKAKFYLRTHDSAYRVFDDNVQLVEKGAFFYGTYIYIVIDVS